MSATECKKQNKNSNLYTDRRRASSSLETLDSMDKQKCVHVPNLYTQTAVNEPAESQLLTK